MKCMIIHCDAEIALHMDMCGEHYESIVAKPLRRKTALEKDAGYSLCMLMDCDTRAAPRSTLCMEHLRDNASGREIDPYNRCIVDGCTSCVGSTDMFCTTHEKKYESDLTAEDDAWLKSIEGEY